jgi:predicted N-acyltransferase
VRKIWAVPPTLELGHAPGVTSIPAEEWDALVDPNDPFTEHGFLAALERSGSVGDDSGWEPNFTLVRWRGELVGAAPSYVKSHSYGEFVFDWSWAAAAERARVSYYPKLVVAVPFTPVSGHRLLVRPDADARAVREALVRGLLERAESAGCSSIHVLFCPEEEKRLLAESGFAPRLGLQFHWRNRAPIPYTSFEDFLGAFRSRNRKQVRHERVVAGGHGLQLQTLTGPELNAKQWAALQRLYAANVGKHGGVRYLPPRFFDEVRQRFAQRVVATLASRGDQVVAGTLNFERGQHLYGRYWGTLEEHEMLHFEMCYYQLIERAVVKGHRLFEAGAQGEHKLKRGLDPAFTHSAHFIRHPGLGAAVARFVEGEAQHVERELAYYKSLSPYSRTGGTGGSAGATEP